MRKRYTLTFIERGSKFLLGMKKRGFGAGKWNGFGGKLGPGEGIQEAARREVLEEIGIELGDLTQIGILEFIFENNPDTTLEVHVFVAKKYTGTPREGEEMRPQWFVRNKIPFNDMWPDDVLWFPLMFAGTPFFGRFYFSADEQKILSYELKELSDIQKDGLELLPAA